MKRLELYILALIPQKIHHHLQIGVVGDVPRHDGEIGTVEQDLAEQLKRLTFRDVVVRLDKGRVRFEELGSASQSFTRHRRSWQREGRTRS